MLDNITCTQFSKLTMTDPEPAEVVEMSSDDDSVLFISDSSPAASFEPLALVFTPTKQDPSPSQFR